MKAGSDFRQRVEALVAQIPRGRIMTYGQIAALCGQPRAARIVGGIAHFGNPDLPWQRVVNKSGGLAAGYPGGRSGHRQVLEAEGVKIDQDYKVDIEKLIWWPIVPMDNKKLPLLVIVGETASGKSELAVSIAQHFNGEIICADSWTARRELNIGTAKPSAEEQARVPHHLLNVVGPDEDFTAAVFKELAEQAINVIKSRGKLPIMVGGTGLYIDGVLYDFGFLEQGDREARQELNDLSIAELLARIERQGIKLDSIDTRNKRRLIRLLETQGARPTKNELREDACILGLKIDREVLRDRVEKRVDAMLAAGLENEVQGLAERYGWQVEGLKGVGYAQWQAYFEGRQSLPETRAKIIKATLDLAKRQRTWFKRNKSIHWLGTPVNWSDVVELITTSLDK